MPQFTSSGRVPFDVCAGGNQPVRKHAGPQTGISRPTDSGSATLASAPSGATITGSAVTGAATMGAATMGAATMGAAVTAARWASLFLISQPAVTTTSGTL